MFFANFVRGLKPEKCAGNDGHNTDAIDALTLTVPVILKYSEATREERNQHIADVIALTRKSTVLQRYAEVFSDILVAVLHGQGLRSAIETFGMR